MLWDTLILTLKEFLYLGGYRHLTGCRGRGYGWRGIIWLQLIRNTDGVMGHVIRSCDFLL